MSPIRPLPILLALAAPLSAQSTVTLPKGLAKTEGNGSDWAGWRFTPARQVFSYDASVFPWGASKTTIQAVEVRRDGPRFGAFVKHAKTVRLYVSYGGNDPAAMDIVFAGNHGQSAALVLGTATAPATLQFPAAAQPPAGAAAPFSVVLPFARPFVVPAGARNLVFDYRVYASTPVTYYWYADSAFTNAGTLSRGSLAVGGQACPATPTMRISNFACWPNCTFLDFIETGRAGDPVIAWIGSPLPKGLPLGKNCFIYVNPFAFQTGVSSADGRGTALFVWGKVPNQPSFVGSKFAYQFAVVRRGFPFLGAIGLSRFGLYTIGAGWTKSANKVVQGEVYTYASTGGRGSFDPDKLVFADWIAAKAPVLRVR